MGYLKDKTTAFAGLSGVGKVESFEYYHKRRA